MRLSWQKNNVYHSNMEAFYSADPPRYEISLEIALACVQFVLPLALINHEMFSHFSDPVPEIPRKSRKC